MYKHKSDTLKKVKLAGSVTFGYIALFCIMLAAAAVIYTVYELTQAPKIPHVITYIVADAVLIALCIFLACKFKKSRALEIEIAEAGEQENEFFKINCVKTSAIYKVGGPLGIDNGSVLGFYITAEGGENYCFLFETPIAMQSFSESAPELFGTLFVRRYNGTNLLCEIKKDI